MINLLFDIPVIGGVINFASQNPLTAGLILAAIWYYITPITIAFFILTYELLLKFDLGGSLINVANALITRNIHFSILPSSSRQDPDRQSQIFRLDHPINMFLNINRGILYFAFFLSVIVLIPFNLAISFPPEIYALIFQNMTVILVQIEPLFLGTLLILSQLDSLIDLATNIVKLVSG